jgi:hypothetical protein
MARAWWPSRCRVRAAPARSRWKPACMTRWTRSRPSIPASTDQHSPICSARPPMSPKPTRSSSRGTKSPSSCDSYLFKRSANASRAAAAAEVEEDGVLEAAGAVAAAASPWGGVRGGRPRRREPPTKRPKPSTPTAAAAAYTYSRRTLRRPTRERSTSIWAESITLLSIFFARIPGRQRA